MNVTLLERCAPSSASPFFASVDGMELEFTQFVLVIGAGGKVSRLSVPLLVAEGHKVAGLVRNPSHAQQLIDASAAAIVTDLTRLDAEEWARLVTPFDVVVWSAGAGGGDPERTYAVDRDAAMRLIDALEELGEFAPKLVMVSYAGAAEATADDDGSSWYAYVESKKAVDQRLLASELDHVILGPTRLTMERSRGGRAVDKQTGADSTTSRELVAQVIVEAVGRDAMPANPYDFEDGDTPAREL